MKTAAEYRAMADECFKWAREARAASSVGLQIDARPLIKCEHQIRRTQDVENPASPAVLN